MHAEHEDLEPSARKSTLLGRAVIYGAAIAGLARAGLAPQRAIAAAVERLLAAR